MMRMCLDVAIMAFFGGLLGAAAGVPRAITTLAVIALACFLTLPLIAGCASRQPPGAGLWQMTE